VTDCPACALKDHQLALLTHSLERQTEACSALSARLAERDHWTRERIAGERRNASAPASRERLVNAVLGVVTAPSEAAWLELLGSATRAVETSGMLDTLSPAPPAQQESPWCPNCKAEDCQCVPAQAQPLRLFDGASPALRDLILENDRAILSGQTSLEANTAAAVDRARAKGSLYPCPKCGHEKWLGNLCFGCEVGPPTEDADV